ncbi:HNH endonuclease signature motif containing protein [Mycolicibacterium anyangense]|uniref:HNH endonuclease signature motif containing protein n=1 Tax=Mycolicibacterium anyangense TaxID=1431246 RepID=UPI0013D57D81|nr:HNH endonuclease signature motif containing protein [Mycolicibacterium anyangense]
MSSSTVVTTPKERLEVLFEELAELAGQRNAIDGRIVDIVAELDRDGLCGMTGARSVAAVVAWKLGTTSTNANTFTTVAGRLDVFPRCVQGLREGQLSLDQVGVIAARAAEGSDEHYAQLASVASVSQLRTAVALEPRTKPRPDPQPSFTRGSDDQFAWWRITLPHAKAATVDAAIAAHREALITEWRTTCDPGCESAPPMPGDLEAFLRLIADSWDAEATRRPHGQHTTVIVHLDIDKRAAELHLGPLMPEAERQYLTCDATCEAWFERDGRPIGAGRATRTVNRRLRRALEHRDRTCAVPGCAATRGLHAHHIVHWEHGGPTDLTNLVLLCPFHHRAHHRGLITITGPADQLVVTDSNGDVLTDQPLARPPSHPPPEVRPYPGPTGERAQWKWYQPYEPQPPPSTN